MLEQLLKEFPNDVRAVFRHFPLPSHSNSLLATQAAEAAGLQGKFAEMSDLLFAQQATWSPMDAAAFEAWLITQAETPLALDVAKFKTDLKSDALVQKALQFQKDAQAAGVTYTPFIMVNGRIWEGIDLNNMRILVKLLREDKNITPGVLRPCLKPENNILPPLKLNWAILSSNFRHRRFRCQSMLSSG